jgi:phenylalanyl-tRNA synthetase beta chain
MKPLGLAGIMGGEHSGINDSTSTVFLEGAFWSPAVIQGRSRRLGFASDAGYRFERGVDFGGCRRAVERATQLILEICGGSAGPLGDVQGELPRRDPVRLRPARVTRLLGIPVPDDTIATMFRRLHFRFERRDDQFLVEPPSYRFDLAIEEDLVEEIARLYGYDAIPAVASAHVQSMLAAPEDAVPAISLKRRLVARGWQEVVTFSFVNSAWEAALAPPGDGRLAPIAVLNPIASQFDVMRTTLAGGLIDVLRTNLARKQDRVRVFETGRCFARAGQGYDQPMRLGGLAYGDALPEQWGAAKRSVDLFDVKGDLQALVAPHTLTTARADHAALHPGRSASVRLDNVPIGWLGEMHPRVVKEFDLPRAPILFELDLAPLLERALPAALALSKFPLVRRDLAIVVDDSVPAQDLLAALDAGRPSQVDAIRLFDVYRGPGIQSGKKSLAILVLIQDTERTLTDAEIDATVAALLKIAADRFGATLRQ